MTIEQAKVWLEMGSDIVLRIDFGMYKNKQTGDIEPMHIKILLKSEDYDEDTIDQKLNDLTRGHEWSLEKYVDGMLKSLEATECEAL